MMMTAIGCKRECHSESEVGKGGKYPKRYMTKVMGSESEVSTVKSSIISEFIELLNQWDSCPGISVWEVAELDEILVEHV